MTDGGDLAGALAGSATLTLGGGGHVSVIRPPQRETGRSGSGPRGRGMRGLLGPQVWTMKRGIGVDSGVVTTRAALEIGAVEIRPHG